MGGFSLKEEKFGEHESLEKPEHGEGSERGGGFDSGVRVPADKRAKKKDIETERH